MSQLVDERLRDEIVRAVENAPPEKIGTFSATPKAAAITRSSVESLGLRDGDRACVVVKTTEVMIAKED